MLDMITSIVRVSHEEYKKRGLTEILDPNKPAAMSISMCDSCGLLVGVKIKHRDCSCKTSRSHRIRPSNHAATNREWLAMEQKRIPGSVLAMLPRGRMALLRS